MHHPERTGAEESADVRTYAELRDTFRGLRCADGIKAMVIALRLTQNLASRLPKFGVRPARVMAGSIAVCIVSRRIAFSIPHRQQAH